MRTPRSLPVYPWADNERNYYGDNNDTALYWDGTMFRIDDASGTRALLIDNTTASVLTIRSEAEQMQIMPSVSGTGYPYIKLYRNSDYRVYLKDAKSFFIYEEGKIFDIAYASDIPTITISVANRDLQFIPNGTGRVRFGTYNATPAADSTGYIEMKDAAGNTRKIMIQA